MIFPCLEGVLSFHCVPTGARQRVQSPLERQPSMISTDRPEMESRPHEFLLRWERLKARREEDDRGWDGWMASLTRWTWVWVSSGRWWWTGKPGMLQLMGSQSLLQHYSTKASIFRRSAFFTVQLSHPYMTTGKTIALTRRTFVGKVMSLLFNILCRLVITFLPRSMGLLISWLQSPFAMILESKKKVCHCFHCFPIYLPWWGWMP